MSAPFEATGETGSGDGLEANVRAAGAAFEDWRERLAGSIRAPEFQRRRAIDSHCERRPLRPCTLAPVRRRAPARKSELFRRAKLCKAAPDNFRPVPENVHIGKTLAFKHLARCHGQPRRHGRRAFLAAAGQGIDHRVPIIFFGPAGGG